MHSHQNFQKFSRVENIILKYLNKQFPLDAAIRYANYNFYSDFLGIKFDLDTSSIT